MATDASKATVDEALVGCLRNKTLTQEQAKILCWRYGLGDAFDPISQGEIAKKLNRDDSYVSRALTKARKALRKFIEENDLTI